jgi:hypothetical protein
MESGFLNKNKSSSSSSLVSRVNNIDGKLLINKEQPLKSILKRAGLEGKTGSFQLPKEIGSISRVSSGPNGANSQNTRLDEVTHTREGVTGTITYSDVGGGLGNTAELDRNKVPNVLNPQHEKGSFVVNSSGVHVSDLDNVKVHKVVTTKVSQDPLFPHDGVRSVADGLVPPVVASLNKFQDQESSSTNTSSTSGAKVVIPSSVVEDMCNKFSNSLYGYFIGQRLAFPLVDNYVKHAWVKFGFQKVILRGNFFFFQFSSREGLLNYYLLSFTKCIKFTRLKVSNPWASKPTNRMKGRRGSVALAPSLYIEALGLCNTCWLFHYSNQTLSFLSLLLS